MTKVVADSIGEGFKKAAAPGGGMIDVDAPPKQKGAPKQKGTRVPMKGRKTGPGQNRPAAQNMPVAESRPTASRKRPLDDPVDEKRPVSDKRRQLIKEQRAVTKLLEQDLGVSARAKAEEKLEKLNRRIERRPRRTLKPKIIEPKEKRKTLQVDRQKAKRQAKAQESRQKGKRDPRDTREFKKEIIANAARKARAAKAAAAAQGKSAQAQNQAAIRVFDLTGGEGNLNVVYRKFVRDKRLRLGAIEESSLSNPYRVLGMPAKFPPHARTVNSRFERAFAAARSDEERRSITEARDMLMGVITDTRRSRRNTTRRTRRAKKKGRD